MHISTYTEQQARFDQAFCQGGSCCASYCEECGRTYFITSPGHGDYDTDELEALRQKAEKEPDKFIEVHDFSSMSIVNLNGIQVVVGCLCDPTKKYSEWIESHARELTEYLKLYWKEKYEKSMARTEDCKEQLTAIESVCNCQNVYGVCLLHGTNLPAF